MENIVCFFFSGSDLLYLGFGCSWVQAFSLFPVCGQDPDGQKLQSLEIMEGGPEIRDQKQR